MATSVSSALRTAAAAAVWGLRPRRGPRAPRCCASSSSSTSSEGVAEARSAAARRLRRFYVKEGSGPVGSCAAGAVFELDAEEARHAVKALRLDIGDKVELCDGVGGVVFATLVAASKRGASASADEAGAVEAPAAPRWTVVAAAGSLKGGRGDWLVEKAAELGAVAVVPLETARSPSADDRRERWKRVALAASKQCLRAHTLEIAEAEGVEQLAERVAGLDGGAVALVGAAGAPPLREVLTGRTPEDTPGGLLVVGPEGDFTDAELSALTGAGLVPVGLGDLRLRCETAAIALLTGARLLVG